MLIDHIWMLFFPDVDLYRMIGRISFPLFWWGIVRGYRVTKNKEKYIQRLFLLWVVSQIPFFYLQAVFDVWIINVVFTLLIGLFSIWLWDIEKLSIWWKISGVIWFACFAQYFSFDYGAYGVGMILLFHIFWWKKVTLFYFTLLTLLFYNIEYQPFQFVYHVQIFSLFSLLFLYYFPVLKYDFLFPFWLKYSFYPLHLMILIGIYLLIS